MRYRHKLETAASHGAAVSFLPVCYYATMVDLADIAAKLHALADELERANVEKDWVDAWRSGDAISTDQAALISKCSRTR
jgi:hypothetical protein